MLPPPALHTVLLGPVNQVLDSVKEYFYKQTQEECIFAIFNDDLEEDSENPVDLYMKKVNIQRSQYFNKKLEGNECQRFIKEKNLEVFSKILEESSMLTHIQVKVLKVLSAIREVYTSCCGLNLDPNHRTVTSNFKNSWQQCLMNL